MSARRTLKSKIPMLVTVWCTLAITGCYPALLPTALHEPSGHLSRRAIQMLIGLVGLGAIGQLKQVMGRFQHSDVMRGTLKTLTYVAICAWTFLGSPLVGRALL